MLCYKDKSFCLRSKECKNKKCNRNIRYEKIPNEFLGFPIAFTDFKECKDFIKRGDNND